jgi:N-sulfoglucosamine sulfohydrolase
VNRYIYRPRFELYKVDSDPWEAVDLAEDPEYANILEELKEKLKSFQRRTSDPWLLKWQYE